MTGPTPDPKHDRPRGRNGAFVASPETAERDAAACRLRIEGKSYEEIAQALGFADRGHAYAAVKRNLDLTRREPAEALRTIWLARLREAYVVAREVMTAEHLAHSGGRLITHDGAPVKDHGPRLAAIDRVVSILNREAKLLGLDATVKIATLTLEEVQAEIARLEAEADELDGDDDGE